MKMREGRVLTVSSCPCFDRETLAICIWLHGENVSEMAVAARLLSFYPSFVVLPLFFVFPTSPPPPTLVMVQASRRPCDQPRAPCAKLPPSLSPVPTQSATLCNSVPRSLARSPGRITCITQFLILHCSFTSFEKVKTGNGDGLLRFLCEDRRCVRLIGRVT